MKDKIIIVLVVLLTISGISLYFGYTNTQRLQRSLREAKNNVEVLSLGLEKYKSKSGQDAATIEALQYTVAEMKRFRQKDLATIEDLGIKLRKASSLINVETQTKAVYQTVVKDSIIRDTVRQCFEYTDKWVDVWGCVMDKTLDGGFASREKITVVGEPTYRRVWLFFKKVDGAKITVTTDNPYTTITATDYILFQ